MIGNYLREQGFLSKWPQGRNCLFICWKNVTSSRIPGAESGGGTLTAFRLLKESVRRPISRPGPQGVPGRGAGGAEDRRLPAAPPASRAGRAAAPAKLGPSSGPSGPRDWVQQGSVPPRDKGWAHALGDGLRIPLRGAARRAAEGPPRAQHPAVGEGTSPAPLPRRAPGGPVDEDLPPEPPPPSASYLCATAAAAPAAAAAPQSCRSHGSPAALKIPDQESRNSRFPTSQFLVPASAPPPAAAVSAASDSASRPRETGPRGRRETAHALPDPA